MSDKALEGRSEHDIQSEALMARVEREDLKSLFYLLAGKPDSVVKVFGGEVVIDKKSMENLEFRIREKLEHHHVESLVASVHVASKGNITREFSDWKEFKAYRSDGGEKTEAVALRWDFMVKLPRYRAPQRHTVTVRISETPNPADVLKIMAASDPEDHSAAEYLGAPVVCRVDFINALLSDEIINIVEGWHKGLTRAPSSSSTVQWLLRHERTVHEASHRFFEILFASLACVLLWRYEGDIGLRVAAIWLLVSFVFVNFAGSFGHWVASALEGAVRSTLSGLVFQLTNGDANRQQKRQEASRRKWRRFAVRSTLALFVNVLAGILTAWILNQ